MSFCSGAGPGSLPGRSVAETVSGAGDGLFVPLLESDETRGRGSGSTPRVFAPLPPSRRAPICSSPCPQAGRGTAVLTLALLWQSRPRWPLLEDTPLMICCSLRDLSGIQFTCASSGLFGDILRLLSAFGKKGYKLKPRCYQYGTFSPLYHHHHYCLIVVKHIQHKTFRFKHF